MFSRPLIWSSRVYLSGGAPEGPPSAEKKSQETCRVEFFAVEDDAVSAGSCSATASNCTYTVPQNQSNMLHRAGLYECFVATRPDLQNVLTNFLASVRVFHPGHVAPFLVFGATIQHIPVEKLQTNSVHGRLLSLAPHIGSNAQE